MADGFEREREETVEELEPIGGVGLVVRERGGERG
jgi:hypothetical protein